MKRFFIIMISLLAMLTARLSADAQEVEIDLYSGWTYIAYPYPTTVDLDTFFSSVTPMNGDKIVAQGGFSTYQNGHWRGAIRNLNPGEGYHYFSNNPDVVTVVLENPIVPDENVVVTTSEPADVTGNTATLGGVVASSDDSYVVIVRGLCWSTNQHPAFNDNYIEAGNGIGSFTVTITELNMGVTYYVRAFAVTDYGIFFGNEVNFTTWNYPTGAISGLFSVSADQQVYFSQGNLQYQASTDTWKFAENQWDIIGSENSNISENYSGWIDLFGWGTSGWDHGANCYQPWSTSIINSDYYAYGNDQYNLYDQTGQAEWGYNPISNGGNTANQWRTLTHPELKYVFNTRTTASGIRYAKATVNNINGVILLPDDWNSSTYSLSNTNSSGASFSSNIISASQWTTLESAGAVFLPSAGIRHGTSVSDYSNGDYWSSSYNDNGYAHFLYFSDSGLNPNSSYNRLNGRSVRLVRVAEN